jgi:hypothetical protein
VNGSYGSCRYSNPNDNNAEYIIIANYDSAFAVNLDTEASTTIAYPSGVTISSPVELIQAIGKVYIFRDGATALEWNGVLTGSPAFAKTANGNYTQPLILTTANNAVCSGGVVTITNTHNLAVGDKVTIMDEGTTGLIRFDKYEVRSINTTVSFTFLASVDDFTATSVVLGVRQSNGRGFTHMPAPPWGVYHQRRLIVPFKYTTTGTSGSEVITARNVSDEIIFSDVLDGETYDQLTNQFRVTGGIADYVQTVHPFTDDAAIAFNRNSLHLITGLSGSLSDVSIKEITREAGLLARKSVATIGNQVFFLSDNGVYAAQFGDLYNLRGAGLPLSSDIEQWMKRINYAQASKAVGVFHDNRYWLAVPIDGSANNNAIMIYNVINSGWESLDVVTANGLDIANLLVGSPDGKNELFSVNSYGGINKHDSREDDVDRIYTSPGVPAYTVRPNSLIETRAYTMNSSDRKKFNSVEIHVESSESNTSNGLLEAIGDNIDSRSSIATMSELNDNANLAVGEDASFRARIGNMRSYSMQFAVTPTAGRPKLRLVRVSATDAFNSTTQAQ